jgi:hypothetical protein
MSLKKSLSKFRNQIKISKNSKFTLKNYKKLMTYIKKCLFNVKKIKIIVYCSLKNALKYSKIKYLETYFQKNYFGENLFISQNITKI